MTNKSLPKLILVDDHDIFRDSLKSMLMLDEIADVIAEACNGEEFLSVLGQHYPDVVLMDIDMPIMNGIEATKAAIEIQPDLNVLVLSMFGEERYYVDLIEAGAKGFILKSSKKRELETAIKEVSNGNLYFSNDLLRNIIAKSGKYEATVVPESEKLKLNEREIELLMHMCQGLYTSEIAEKMFLSVKTIENYRVRLLAKTNCKTSVGLVVFAIKNGYIEI